jgi:hypothetical protein
MTMQQRTAVMMVVGFTLAGSTASAAQQPQSTAKSAAKKPRVFFVQPKNGATVTSPVHLKFGAQNFAIAPVPAGEVTTPRQGVGHYHVGVDQACLAPSKTIVKGTPSWVHLGDGKDEMDMQLPSGRHRLALQIGDDLHNTLPGLCSVITVNVK